eukprot:6709621-Prorocentrum_lima.AAC.1
MVTKCHAQFCNILQRRVQEPAYGVLSTMYSEAIRYPTCRKESQSIKKGAKRVAKAANGGQ